LRAAGGNLLAVGIGLFIALALLEGSARLMANALGVSPYMRYDPTIGWKATPATAKRHKSANPPFEVTYEINARGHRGAYYEAQKAEGTRRVVVIGDSVGFGWGIPEDRHFAALLDTALPETEVINLSLSGYGTDQEYLRLKEEGLMFAPDLVVLQVTPNDFDEVQHAFYNQKPKPYFIRQPGGSLMLANVPVTGASVPAREFYRQSIPLPFREWLGWNSYAYTWLNEKYYGVRRRSAPQTGKPLPRYSAHSVALFGDIVALLKRTLDEAGVQLLIVHAAKEVSEQRPFTDATIPLLDLSAKFDDYARETGAAAMFSDGFHWNERGHAIAAAEASKTIAEMWRSSYASR
jgi:lysophospholipase L1-like esterase